MPKPARLLTFLVLSVAAVLLILRERQVSISAADSESITWGAVEPTWSPDGKQIAFSLFGSIWRVPAEGGEAEQITSSPGYHAHPSWSPKGGQIVYINGENPRGRIPNVYGKLAVVNLSTGAERQLPSPHATAGSPTFTASGDKVVCGLSVPNSGALLHEFDLASGESAAIQTRLQRAPAGNWIDAAWNAKSNEIFFAAQRLGEPQIWSMPAAGKPIMVQLPLSRYRPEDIVQIDRVAALPDGSGAVYSAVAVNGKGDYELYRVPREGGDPVPITNTTRDEFDPAVSPDGRLIAHVSNHLGNNDIFTIPAAGGEQKHVRITGLKFRYPAGQVRVRVLDELGNPTQARLYVEASDGKAYCPSGEQIFYYPIEPGGGRPGFFIASGDDTFPAPAGSLKFTAMKGIEYRLLDQTVSVEPNQTTEVTLRLTRWTNWAQRGWYSGENHFHANYNGNYYQKPLQSLGWLQAEDFNAANMIVANSQGAFVHDKEFFTGTVSTVSTGRYKLFWGQEYRNSDPLGHMGFLNIKKQVPPSYTSVIGSDSPFDFPLNTMAAQAARVQGGLVTYMHPNGAMPDIFDTNLGAKESPVTAALGALDALDIMPYDGAWPLYYSLLNAGFKISPGAGTDAFTNWRGINRIPGSSRQYVEIGGAMDWDRWLARFREGRAFATTGPLLTFTVNGQPMGSEIRAAAGEPYRARIALEAASQYPFERVELIQNGKVIETREILPNTTSARLEKEVMVTQSSWFAATAWGRPVRGAIDGQTPKAHTGVVYVSVDGQPTLIREDVELMIRWVDRLWAYLVERDNFGPGDNRAKAKQMIDQARAHYVEKLANAR